MTHTKLKTTKTVNVPFRISTEQIEDVLTTSDAIFNSAKRKFCSYSIDFVFNMITQRFTSMPAFALFEDAGFFYNGTKPTDFMHENGLAGKLSDFIKLSPSEIKRQKCYITEKGVFFLLSLLYRLRDQIDYQIFYKTTNPSDQS